MANQLRGFMLHFTTNPKVFYLIALGLTLWTAIAPMFVPSGGGGGGVG